MERVPQAEARVPAAKRSRRSKPKKSANATGLELCVNVSGDWMPAESLRTRLIDAVRTYPTIVLNMAGLTYVDPASLQVLIAAEQAGWLSSGTVSLRHFSDEVKLCLSHAGLEKLCTAEAGACA